MFNDNIFSNVYHGDICFKDKQKDSIAYVIK